VRVHPAELREGRIWLPRLLVLAGLAPSTSEGRRLITQGGIRVNGTPVTDPDQELDEAGLDGLLIQKGKRHFRRVVLRG